MIRIGLFRSCNCGIKINYGKNYCYSCQVKYDEQQKQRHKEYKRTREDEKEQTFYNSKAWIETRDYIKGKYQGLCLYSFYMLKRIVYCDVVHHIVEIKDVGGWDKRLDEDNLITLSDAAHSVIHNLYRKNREEAQKMLRGLKRKWESDFGTGEITSAFFMPINRD